jgi:hypothetical protein
MGLVRAPASMARPLVAEKQKYRYDPFVRASDEAQADRHRLKRDAARYAGMGRMTKTRREKDFLANSSVTH